MTEVEWQQCEDPKPMLEHLGDKISSRKLRLFACACCRSVWGLLAEEPIRRAVEAAESFADGKEKLRNAHRDAQKVVNQLSSYVYASSQYRAHAAARAAAETAGHSARRAVSMATYHAAESVSPSATDRDKEVAAQAGLLRDIVPYASLPIDLDPVHRISLVMSLARAAYDERFVPSGHLDPVRLAVLADALEEGGCTNADILAHLRAPGPHVRGCWPVDLLLARE
jgi:hypothetical protein